MRNHDTLVIIRKVGNPRIEEIHDKVEKIEFVGDEWHVVMRNGVVYHYPSSSYLFELIDSLNYYGGKPLTVFFTDGSIRTFKEVKDVQITHARGEEPTMTIVREGKDGDRVAVMFPYHDVLSYSDIERGNK